MFILLSLLFLISTCVHSIANEEAVNSGNDPNSVHQNYKPVSDRVLKVYIYNVTNSEEFLKNGTKPVVKELGPYIYLRTLDDGNKQSRFGEENFYKFNETMSNGHENDSIVVPNIPMLMILLTSSRNSASLNSTLNFFNRLKEKPFVNVNVKQFLWGYESPMLTIYNFGQPINKSFVGAISLLRSRSIDFVKYGLINEANDRFQSKKHSSEQCNKSISLDGSDFSGNLNKDSVIHAYNENFCKIIPLSYEKSVSATDDVIAYRFAANKDMFSDELPLNPCYCDRNPPCPRLAPADTTLCSYVFPYPLSFLHFYLSNDSYRTAVEGISPSDPEKHKFYIDVQPTTGVALNVKAKLQLNVNMPRMKGITEGGNFPEMIFPLMWFEEGSY